jgi:plasmid stabilization system protein ParE
MSRILIWSQKSRDNFLDIIGYIQDKWGRKKATDFIDKTDVVLEKITVYPLMYPKSKKKKNLRQAVVTKQTSLTYKVSDESVELIEFYDNRRGKK